MALRKAHWPRERTKQRTYGVEGNSGGPLENGSWVPTSVYTPKSGADGSNVSVRKKKKDHERIRKRQKCILWEGTPF